MKKIKKNKYKNFLIMKNKMMKMKKKKLMLKELKVN